MKPKIDLRSPLTQFAIQYHQKQVEIALDSPRSVENAVIPIYAIPKSKAHRAIKKKPEQIGSGVLISIKDEYFLFCATHVFFAFDNYVLLTGAGDNTAIQELSGERFSRGNPNSPRTSTLDASVYHIQSSLSETLKKTASTLDDFDLDVDTAKSIFMACGYRIKNSNTSGNTVNSKRECFPSVEIHLKDHKRPIIDTESHIVLSYEDQVLVNNKWQTSPIPRGMSGGAIIKVQGTSLKFPPDNKHNLRQLLSAIIIEQYRDEKNKPGILVGTRIGVHLGLIYQFLPDLLEDSIISKIILPKNII